MANTQAIVGWLQGNAHLVAANANVSPDGAYLRICATLDTGSVRFEQEIDTICKPFYRVTKWGAQYDIRQPKQEA